MENRRFPASINLDYRIIQYMDEQDIPNRSDFLNNILLENLPRGTDIDYQEEIGAIEAKIGPLVAEKERLEREASARKQREDAEIEAKKQAEAREEERLAKEQADATTKQALRTEIESIRNQSPEHAKIVDEAFKTTIPQSIRLHEPSIKGYNMWLEEIRRRQTIEKGNSLNLY